MRTQSSMIDDLLWFHREAAPITSTQFGTVTGTPASHLTGPGSFNNGTLLVVNVVEAVDTDASETYSVDFMGERDGGGFEVLASFPIPATTVESKVAFPVTNDWWDSLPMDTIKVRLNLAGTAPSLDATVKLTTNIT